MNLLRYDSKPIWITASGNVDLDPLCNGWTAINRGTLTAFVNGIELLPAPSPGVSPESVGVSGNAGEVYAGNVFVKVDPTDPSPLVVFIQKYYLPGL